MVIGFIGAGTMGRPMTKNLRQAGYDMQVFVRSQAAAERISSDGCTPQTDLITLANNVDVLLLCLPNDAIVEDIVQRVLPSLKSGAIIVDHSTVSPYTSQRLATMAAQQGIEYVDAPISGGPMGAEAGTLCIMVGGTESAFEQCLPLFEVMGQKIVHMGSVGAGNLAKLINQMIIGVSQLAIAEGFVLGAKAGINLNQLYDVISASTGNSSMLHRIVPENILQGDFTPRFTVDLLLKDLRLANDVGRQSSVRMLSGALAEQLFHEAQINGFGPDDIAAIIRPLEQLTGIEARVNKNDHMASKK